MSQLVWNDQLLREAAERLRRSGGYWGTFRKVEHLMGWLFEQGKCVYCCTDLITNRNQATTDHLLPWSKYQDLDKHALNAVPSCTYCNQLKGGWDPNSDGSQLYTEGGLNTEIRLELLRRARVYIDGKRKTEKSIIDDLTAWTKALEECRVKSHTEN